LLVGRSIEYLIQMASAIIVLARVKQRLGAVVLRPHQWWPCSRSDLAPQAGLQGRSRGFNAEAKAPRETDAAVLCVCLLKNKLLQFRTLLDMLHVTHRGVCPHCWQKLSLQLNYRAD